MFKPPKSGTGSEEAKLLALPSSVKLEEGYEFAAIDVEWCASSNPGEEKTPANPAYFSLHMSDNTRIEWHLHKKPVLPYARLTWRLRTWVGHLPEAKGCEAQILYLRKMVFGR